MISGRSRKTSMSAFFLAALGVAFCAWNGLDASSVPCLTDGCTLFQSFAVGGISLWWVGLVVFAVLAGLALAGALGAGWFLSGMAVGLDCIPLIVMTLTAPCFSCLVAALLLALTFWRFREELHTSQTRAGVPLSRSWLLALWSLLFVVNVGLVFRGSVEPWPIQMPESGEVRTSIYFSTSCGACRQLIMGMPVAEAREVAWYPVAEDGTGLFAISAMNTALQSGTSLDKAFRIALDTQAPTLWESLTSPHLLVMQFRLWVNQAHVLRAGGSTMPFVEFHGLPEVLLRQPKQAPASSRSSSPSSSSSTSSAMPMNNDLPFLNLQSAGECTDGKTTTGADCTP